MSRVLLTDDQVARWRHRLEEIARERSRLDEEELDIESKLQAVAVLLGAKPSDTSGGASRPRSGFSDFRSATRAFRKGKPTWSNEIVRVLEGQDDSLSYAELLEKIEAGSLRGRYAKSSKGFYHAVSRLEKQGHLCKQDGRVLLTQEFRDYLRRSQFGENASNADSEPPRRGSLAEAVREYLREVRTGSESRAIRKHLEQDDRFRAALQKNPTNVYTVLSRLTKRGEIRKEGNFYYPLDANEAPTGSSEADTGGA